MSLQSMQLQYCQRRTIDVRMCIHANTLYIHETRHSHTFANFAPVSAVVCLKENIQVHNGRLKHFSIWFAWVTSEIDGFFHKIIYVARVSRTAHFHLFIYKNYFLPCGRRVAAKPFAEFMLPACLEPLFVVNLLLNFIVEKRNWLRYQLISFFFILLRFNCVYNVYSLHFCETLLWKIHQLYWVYIQFYRILIYYTKNEYAHRSYGKTINDS